MITYVAGNLFTSPAQVLVNTVNTEGVMGKGIALQFRKTFPQMFEEYQRLCEKGTIDIGVLWIYKTSHKWVLNFPTKRAWRQPSEPKYIELGLRKLVSEFNELKIHSIAFPALGCGNGELDWESTVKPLMENYLSELPADIFIHPPLPAEDIPEHKNQNQIVDWLRSEPYNLPFSEVWRDLEGVVSKNAKFQTGETEFTAKITSDSKGKALILFTESRPRRVEYDELCDVWSGFRALGYLRRGVVTKDIEKILSYIMPVLAELPYVEKIELSTNGNFSKHPYVGLQYIAPTDRVSQPSLFS